MNTEKRQAITISNIENAENKTDYRNFAIVTETSRGIHGGKVIRRYVYDSYGKRVWCHSTIKECKSRIDLMIKWGSSEAPQDESFWSERI